MKRYQVGGPTSYAESGSAGGSDMSFGEAFKAARAVAKRAGRDPDAEEFTWKGKKYKAELASEKSKAPEKADEGGSASTRGPMRRYATGPTAVEKRRQAEFSARNPQYSEREPGLKAVDEELLGPKAKAALAGAGTAAAGYGVKKLRDFLMRRGQQTRSQGEDVLKGSGAMSRSAAARDAEAAAYAERIKNARRSPGMPGYKKGGAVKSSASRRADGIAQRGKTRGKMI